MTSSEVQSSLYVELLVVMDGYTSQLALLFPLRPAVELNS